MMDLAEEFDRAIGTAMLRGLRPGAWRSEIERRFIAARFANDEGACQEILGEWLVRIATAEAEQAAAAVAERHTRRQAERDAAAARMSPREVIEAVERGGWHRLSTRADGAIVIAGGPPADTTLMHALEQQADAIRTLLRERERKEVLVPAAS